jgi:MIP family channel proteins
MSDAGPPANKDAGGRPPPLWRRCIAELVGTYVLTLIGAGIEIVDFLSPGHIDRTLKAAAPGLIVAALIFALGDISGAHINPAVTTMFAVRGVFQWRCVPWYWAAQLSGAIAAAGTLRWLFGTARSVGINEIHITAGRAGVVEAIMTAVLVIVILNAAHKHSLIGAAAAIPVGATIAALGMFGGELTTTSLNPARSLGPAIVSGDYTHIGVFVVGPFAGALAGLLVASMLRPAKNPDEQSSAQGE